MKEGIGLAESQNLNRIILETDSELWYEKNNREEEEGMLEGASFIRSGF